MHYYRWYRNGDPLRLVKQEPLEMYSYRGMHRRLQILRGPATNQACFDCGKPATQWSYDNADPNEILKPHPYSLDPMHYVGRCRSCHKKFDIADRRLRDVAV